MGAGALAGTLFSCAASGEPEAGPFGAAAGAAGVGLPTALSWEASGEPALGPLGDGAFTPRVGDMVTPLAASPARYCLETSLARPSSLCRSATLPPRPRARRRTMFSRLATFPWAPRNECWTRWRRPICGFAPVVAVPNGLMPEAEPPADVTAGVRVTLGAVPFRALMNPLIPARCRLNVSFTPRRRLPAARPVALKGAAAALPTARAPRPTADVPADPAALAPLPIRRRPPTPLASSPAPAKAVFSISS